MFINVYINERTVDETVLKAVIEWERLVRAYYTEAAIRFEIVDGANEIHVWCDTEPRNSAIKNPNELVEWHIKKLEQDAWNNIL